MKDFIYKILEFISNILGMQSIEIEECEEDLDIDINKPISLDCIIPSEPNLDNNLINESSKADYSNILVILDCGHGITTPGKRSPAACNTNADRQDLKFWEYKWNREEGKLIADKLERCGFRVKFTVDPNDDTDVTLSKRYKIANQYKLDNPEKRCIFISIHVNAATTGCWTSARGWSVYTTKGQNNSDVLATKLYYAAKDILTPLNQKLRQDFSDNDPDFEENFTVIYGSNMPAVLTENLFQDNIQDVEFLLSDKGKEAIAEIHLRGIKEFINNC